jgi:murein DD-endopeptidase MepM/ murein hydrolase activator NlpD
MCSERSALLRNGFLAGVLLLLLFLPPLAGCAPTGVYHVVEPGQTFYRIAKTYGIDEAQLAKVNRVANPGRIEVGQRLYIPGAKVPLTVPVIGAKQPPSPVPTPPAKASKEQPQSGSAKPAPAPAAKSARDPVGRPVVPPAPGTFVWPVRGKLVTEFGALAGTSSKGVEIAVPHGTPVVAAAAGKVIYSSDMRGYGNLIILEHADNYFTVYGFNAKNLAAVNSFVGQGERIALSGTPDGGKSPRLHFEIRKGRAAVNPIFFLP